MNRARIAVSLYRWNNFRFENVSFVFASCWDSSRREEIKVGVPETVEDSDNSLFYLFYFTSYVREYLREKHQVEFLERYLPYSSNIVYLFSLSFKFSIINNDDEHHDQLIIYK